MIASTLRSLMLLVVLGSLPVARAELATFTVDPARSSVTLSGSASGAPLQPQGAGSLTAAYRGSIVLEMDATTVRFTGGSRFDPEELHSWEPGPAGVTGTAPASYGGKAQIGSGFFSVSAVAATRRLSFDLLSGTLAMTGGAFNADGLLFQFVETNNPALDYRTSGLLSERGSQVLSGLATNKLAGVSTLVTEGNLQTLTIKVDAAYRFELLVPEDSVLQLNGQLVATRTLSGGTPTIVIEPVAPGATSMTLAWPAGFKLQKVSIQQGSGWTDTGATSPASIPFSTAGELFQVVPQ